MDAGIGAAGCGDAQRLLRETLPSGLERALHRRPIGLNLPTGVCTAVVGDGQFEPTERS